VSPVLGIATFLVTVVVVVAVGGVCGVGGVGVAGTTVLVMMKPLVASPVMVVA